MALLPFYLIFPRTVIILDFRFWILDFGSGFNLIEAHFLVKIIFPADSAD
jgi:hypothetical protein